MRIILLFIYDSPLAKDRKELSLSPVVRLFTLMCRMTASTKSASHFAGMTIMFIGEIKFTEWTRAGVLRHAEFVGLRDDKDASDVSRT
jgi:bifunctional non-homologous end joining protein LigD